MDKIARAYLYFKGKLIKKRRSINAPPPTEEKRKKIVESPEVDVEPVKWDAGSLAFLRASTPVCETGTVSWLKGPDAEEEKEEEEDSVSQAISAAEWEEGEIEEIKIDSPSEFVLVGGDETKSEFGVEEEEEVKAIDPSGFEFEFNDEYDEDDFDAIAVMQKVFPAAAAVPVARPGYFVHPTRFVADEEGFEWEEPIGWSRKEGEKGVEVEGMRDMRGWKDEDIRAVAQAVIDKDAAAAAGAAESPVLHRRLKLKMDDSPMVSPLATSSPLAATATATAAAAARGSKAAEPSAEMSPSISAPRKADVDYYALSDEEWLASLFERTGLSHEMPKELREKVAPKKSPTVQQPQQVTKVSPRMPKAVTNLRYSTPTISSPIDVDRELMMMTDNLLSELKRRDNLELPAILTRQTISNDYVMSARARAALLKKETDYWPVPAANFD